MINFAMLCIVAEKGSQKKFISHMFYQKFYEKSLRELLNINNSFTI